ncbi:MAG: hypothetical protein JOZ08_01905 [Verrucomicrobia bacterium]|nr:hypothetical protein [Verrucomicrobiota bacterium]
MSCGQPDEPNSYHGTAPPELVNSHLANRIYPFPGAPAEVDVLLYWSARVESDPGNAWLRDQIVATYNHESAPT